VAETGRSGRPIQRWVLAILDDGSARLTGGLRICTIAFDLRLRLGARGPGDNQDANYGNRGAVCDDHLECAADIRHGVRLRRRDQHLQFGNLGCFGCNQTIQPVSFGQQRPR
jgi:hypothetical protein